MFIAASASLSLPMMSDGLTLPEPLRSLLQPKSFFGQGRSFAHGSIREVFVCTTLSGSRDRISSGAARRPSLGFREKERVVLSFVPLRGRCDLVERWE